MKFIFLIASEHQLLVVKYAILHFNLSPNDIILFIQESPSSNFDSFKLKSDFGLVYSFKNWTFYDLLTCSTSIDKFLELCREVKSKCDKNVFLPSQYSDDSTILLAKILQPIKVYLLDEGSASFLVIDKRRGIGRMIFIIKLFIKSFLYKVYLREPRDIEYFTQFDLKVGIRDSVQKYTATIIDNICNFNYGKVGVLGTSIVELNMLREEDYLSYLRIIVNRHSNKDLHYFKHRKESGIKLEKIKNLGFEIVSINEPFEVYFSNLSLIPYKLISFSTSISLFNLSRKYMNLPILEVYHIPAMKLKKYRRLSDTIMCSFRTNDKLNIVEF